ncbi:MAG: hypothetical protein ABRQ37_26250 [Candidatus Eremiobacterota bacterium]
MPKKKDSIGTQIDKTFNTLEDKIDKLDKKTDECFNKVDEHFDHLETYIFKEVCRLDNKIDKRFDEMDVKLDKVLSAISNLVVTTENIKQEITVIADKVRQHEDKLETIT